MKSTQIKKEIKHIRGMAKVLNILADEVEKKKHFDKEDTDLFKKVGSAILFQGVAIDFKT